ncbi:MAG: MJ0042-type zinc finger domain-containing protein [Xanthobacteraceae bacterium]
MLIVCPTCATSYDVELASLQPNGRQVRCVRCRAVWHAAPSHADKLLAAAEALGPEPHMAQAPAGAFAEESALQSADEPPADDVAWAAPDELPAAAPAAAEMDAGEPGAAIEVEAPSIAPVDLDAGQPPIMVEQAADEDAEPLEDIETYAARHNKRGFRRPSLHWPLSNLQSAVLALIIVDAVLVGWRNDFVRILPQTASFYSTLGLSVNLRGLALDAVTTTTEQHEGVPILVVEGSIVNNTRKIVDVPRLKFVVRNSANEEVYSWTAVAPRATLPPGETVAFRSRLASPPTDGRDVLVRFVTRHDIIAGTR